MSIQVTGGLKTPMNTVLAGASIRVTADITSDDVLGCMFDEVLSDVNGNYDFTLLEGRFRIEVNGDDEYCFSALVEVTGTTTTPISLPALINNYSVT